MTAVGKKGGESHDHTQTCQSILRPNFSKTKTRSKKTERVEIEFEFEFVPGLETESSLLPRALFVAVCLQALAALVLRHFQTTFLLQITHGVLCSVVTGDSECRVWCKARTLHPFARAVKRF